jgi:hypothetical protein
MVGCLLLETKMSIPPDLTTLLTNLQAIGTVQRVPAANPGRDAAQGGVFRGFP